MFLAMKRIACVKEFKSEKENQTLQTRLVFWLGMQMPNVNCLESSSQRENNVDSNRR